MAAARKAPLGGRHPDAIRAMSRSYLKVGISISGACRSKSGMRTLAASFVLLASAASAQEPSIQNRWRSPGGNSIIEIAPCGSALCGTVAWASEKAKQDARKATEQLIGTQLLTGLHEKKPGRWQGKLFIP